MSERVNTWWHFTATQAVLMSQSGQEAPQVVQIVNLNDVRGRVPKIDLNEWTEEDEWEEEYDRKLWEWCQEIKAGIANPPTDPKYYSYLVRRGFL